MAGWKVLVRTAKVQPQKQKVQPEAKPKALPVAQSVLEPSDCIVAVIVVLRDAVPPLPCRGSGQGAGFAFSPFNFNSLKLHFPPTPSFLDFPALFEELQSLDIFLAELYK